MPTPLASLGNVVPEGYTYYTKRVVPADELRLPSARLKWYDIYPDDAPVTPDQRAEARTLVSGLDLGADLGFVILHRAGGVLLLLVTTWRHTNEMWESVYYKRAGDAGGYEPVPQTSSHKATYCVWELGPVWHERNAWVRFLSSPRDDAAKQAYLDDRFAGEV